MSRSMELVGEQLNKGIKDSVLPMDSGPRRAKKIVRLPRGPAMAVI